MLIFFYYLNEYHYKIEIVINTSLYKDVAMNRTNIVDFLIFQEEHKNRQPPKKDITTDELSIAIQGLIQRLRDHNPISQAS